MKAAMFWNGRPRFCSQVIAVPSVPGSVMYFLMSSVTHVGQGPGIACSLSAVDSETPICTRSVDQLDRDSPRRRLEAIIVAPTEEVSLLDVSDLPVLGSLQLNLLKPPLQTIRQQSTSFLLRSRSEPIALSRVRGDEGDLAIHKVDDRCATLFPVDTGSQVLSELIGLHGKHDRGDVVVLCGSA